MATYHYDLTVTMRVSISAISPRQAQRFVDQIKQAALMLPNDTQTLATLTHLQPPTRVQNG